MSSELAQKNALWKGTPRHFQGMWTNSSPSMCRKQLIDEPVCKIMNSKEQKKR